MIGTITAALTEAIPKLAGYLEPQSHKMKLELEAAHADQKKKMGALQESDRFLFASHDSMAYYARAYGLQARALTTVGGELPKTAPATLTEWIRSHRVRSLFRESFTDPLPLCALLQPVNVNPDFPINTLTLPAAGKNELVGLKEYDFSTALSALLHTLDLVQFTLATDG